MVLLAGVRLCLLRLVLVVREFVIAEQSVRANYKQIKKSLKRALKNVLFTRTMIAMMNTADNETMLIILDKTT